MSESRPLPLRGIRVLDFTWAAAGPFAQTLLAMMGAEVIKIESLANVDLARRNASGVRIPPGEVDISHHFVQMNLNKLGVQINLKESEGIGLAKDLVRISNVVAENFRPGVMERLGLGYETLRAIKPDIIMLSTSTGGRMGPDSGVPGYAPIFNATSGLGYITGYEDGPPTEVRLSVDLRVALTGAFALVAALYHWRQTGQGQYIDLSAVEANASLIGSTVLGYSITGRPPGRSGNRDDSMSPHDCYRCAGEGWVSIAVASDEEWETLCRAMGMPDLARDERFAGELVRWQNQDLLRPIIESWTSQRTDYEVMESLQKAGVAAVASLRLDQLMVDPHVRERGINVEVQHPKIGPIVAPGVPWKLSETKDIPHRPGPLMGEHNDYVFCQLLGLSPGHVAGLKERRVIY